jgi:WD40 repeat protein
MHAERDHLVTVVFPELRERLERLGLDFYDVDLRWGVPEQEVDGEAANSWAYCKHWIDRVQPFFISMVGERYGWVPPASEVESEEDRKRWPGLSITDMEIRYALSDVALSHRRCFFYLRKTRVPHPPATSPKDFRDFVDREHDEKMKGLRVEIETCGRPVRHYEADWREDHFVSLGEFGELVLDDLWSGVLRDPRYVSPSAWNDALGHAPEEEPLYMDESQPIPREVWEKILACTRPPEADPAEEEARQMALFAEHRLRWFQDRRPTLERLHGFATEASSGIQLSVCVVKAVAGQGKSSLLAKLRQELIEGPSEHGSLVISHFVGATEGSTQVRALLLKLCRELESFGTGSENGEGERVELDQSSLADLRMDLARRLRNHTGRRLVIILDALNQLTSGHELDWLPQQLDPDVRIIVSCTDDAKTSRESPETQVLSALRNRHNEPKWLELPPLEDRDVREIVIQYLREYSKVLDQSSIDAICRLEQARNPLYLLVMLGELRTLGGNEMNRRVPELIAEMEVRHPDTESLFDWVLERLEVFGGEAVGSWCSHLALGREGMSSRELRELVATSLDLDEAVALRIERGLRRYLQRRGSQLDYFHGQLRSAVERRYIDSSKILRSNAATLHQKIAKYFEARWSEPDLHALSELPYHLVAAREWQRLESILTNSKFLDNKVRELSVWSLIDDFELAIDAWPARAQDATADALKALQYVKGALELSATSLESDSSQLHGHLMGRLIQSQGPVIERLLNDTRRSSGKRWLRPKRASLERPGGRLRTTIDMRESLSGVELFADGRQCLARARGKLFLVDCTRGMVFQSFEGRRETEQLVGYRVVRDGTELIAAWADRLVRRWVLQSGALIFEGHVPEEVLPGKRPHPDLRLRGSSSRSPEFYCIQFTSDGKKLFVPSATNKDPVLLVWDIEKEEVIRYLGRHHGLIETAAISDEDQYVVSGSSAGEAIVWDFRTGNAVASSIEGMESVADMELVPGSSRVVLGRKDSPGESNLEIWDWRSNELRSIGRYDWTDRMGIAAEGGCMVAATSAGRMDAIDLESGRRLFTLEEEPEGLPGANRPIDAISVTRDGSRAFAAARKGSVEVFDLRAGGRLVDSLPGHEGIIEDVAVSSDGRTAVTVSLRGRLHVWDMTLGRKTEQAAAHSGAVWTLAVRSETCEVVTGSDDSMLHLWDGRTGKRTRTFVGHQARRIPALCLTRDGRAISGADDQTVRVWEMATGRLIHTLRGQEGYVEVVCTDPDENRVLSSGRNGRVAIWNLTTGELLGTIEAHEEWVMGMAVTPDGKSVVTGSQDESVKVWDIKSGKRLGELRDEGQKVRALILLGNGRRLVTASDDGVTRIWDLTRGELVHSLKGTNRDALALSALSGTDSVACCGLDGSLNIWNAHAGKLVRCLIAAGPAIRAIGSTPSARYVLTAADDGFSIWEVEGGEKVAHFVGDSSMTGCIALDDTTFVTSERSGRVHILELVGDEAG